MSCRIALASLASVVLLASGCGKQEDGKKKDADKHEHDDSHGGGRGVVARLTGPDGVEVGYVELKLHDDKGDLELWIARDEKFAAPFDLALDTRVTVTFLDREGKTVQLAVRNRDKNEDEEGKASIRDGKTNYFIFPGDSGQDGAWLKGSDFKARVRVTFDADGKAYASRNFDLKPHTHGGDHGHDH